MGESIHEIAQADYEKVTWDNIHSRHINSEFARIRHRVFARSQNGSDGANCCYDKFAAATLLRPQLSG